MPEFRQNMVSKEWVIIATERAKRPDQFHSEKGEEKPPSSSSERIALSARAMNR